MRVQRKRSIILGKLRCEQNSAWRSYVSALIYQDFRQTECFACAYARMYTRVHRGVFKCGIFQLKRAAQRHNGVQLRQREMKLYYRRGGKSGPDRLSPPAQPPCRLIRGITVIRTFGKNEFFDARDGRSPTSDLCVHAHTDIHMPVYVSQLAVALFVQKPRGSC